MKSSLFDFCLCLWVGAGKLDTIASNFFLATPGNIGPLHFFKSNGELLNCRRARCSSDSLNFQSYMLDLTCTNYLRRSTFEISFIPS